jgi:hypothetical protein
MAVHDFEGIFYVNKVPQIRFADGLFHVCHALGRNTQFEFVMQPKIFASLVRACQSAVDDFRSEQVGKVKPLRKHH